MGLAAGRGRFGLDQNASRSKTLVRAMMKKEMRSIIDFFGVFEKLLREQHNAQESGERMIASAVFNLETFAAFYYGPVSTSYDRAAINLTWIYLLLKKTTFR